MVEAAVVLGIALLALIAYSLRKRREKPAEPERAHQSERQHHEDEIRSRAEARLAARRRVLARAEVEQENHPIPSIDYDTLTENDPISTILKAASPTNLWAVDLDPAVELLRIEGSSGADRVAVVLRDMLEARTEGIVYALQVAGSIQRSRALHTILESVAASVPMVNKSRGLFDPELSGGGRIGWTDATHARVKELAEKALAGADNDARTRA